MVVYALLAAYPSIKFAIYIYLVESPLFDKNFLALFKLYKRILSDECDHFSPLAIHKGQI